MVVSKYLDKKWFVAQIKPNSYEKAVQNLERQGFETFVPKMETTQRQNNKFIIKDVYVFPGYIFVKPKIGSSYISIKSTKGVKNFIKFDSTFPIVSEQLIKFIKSRMKHFERQAKNRKKYKKGDLVHIETGPFKEINDTKEIYNFLIKSGMEGTKIFVE